MQAEVDMTTEIKEEAMIIEVMTTAEIVAEAMTIEIIEAMTTTEIAVEVMTAVEMVEIEAGIGPEIAVMIENRVV